MRKLGGDLYLFYHANGELADVASDTPPGRPLVGRCLQRQSRRMPFPSSYNALRNVLNSSSAFNTGQIVTSRSSSGYARAPM
jgi:hypothetical protein